MRRAEAYRAAGADVLLVMAQTADHFREIGRRLGPPLMTLTSDGHLRKIGLAGSDLAALGFRLMVDAMTPVLLFHKVMKRCYRAMAEGNSAALFVPEGMGREQNELHETIGARRVARDRARDAREVARFIIMGVVEFEIEGPLAIVTINRPRRAQRGRSSDRGRIGRGVSPLRSRRCARGRDSDGCRRMLLRGCGSQGGLDRHRKPSHY